MTSADCSRYRMSKRERDAQKRRRDHDQVQQDPNKESHQRLPHMTSANIGPEFDSWRKLQDTLEAQHIHSVCSSFLRPVASTLLFRDLENSDCSSRIERLITLSFLIFWQRVSLHRANPLTRFTSCASFTLEKPWQTLHHHILLFWF